MNIYAIFPLVAVIAYIPLLITTAGSRPREPRSTLFLAFLVAAMSWSLTDVFLRSNYFPDAKFALFQAIVITYSLMAVQLHCFTSSFFGPSHGRWLPFAYTSLAAIVALVVMGYVPESLEISGKETYLDYGRGIILVYVPLIILFFRNIYVFSRQAKIITNPVYRNQTLTLLYTLISIMALTTFSVFSPFAKEFPISHFGNIINAFILSYAVVRHNLIDIKIVLRQGAAWAGLVLIGVIFYWLVLYVFSHIIPFNYQLTTVLVTSGTALVVAAFIFKIKDIFFRLLGRAMQGDSYNVRVKLAKFIDKIHSIFSLKEQGGELLSLLTQAIRTRQACMLFKEIGSDDYIVQFARTEDRDSDLRSLRIRAGNPIIKYLEREKTILSRDKLEVLPAFLGMWPQEKADIFTKDIQLFVPVISRERLIAILVLGEKSSGRYTLEDFSIIEDVTARVAVSLEKEYLREQLREREEELSVINNCSAILSSSLDIQEIFGHFVEELKRVVDVSWASIVLLQDGVLRCAALSSPENAEYLVGDIIPTKSTGAGWVISHKTTFLETDLQKDHSFGTGEGHRKHGLRTIVYLPLISKGRAMGCLISASFQPHAYTQRHVKLLEQLTSQIAMPLENAQLYADAEKRARIDELTGLLNRRSLDEMLDDEISRHSRYGGKFSVAIIDLDFFKAYNDTYGHLSGDNLLKEVGKHIKGTLRATDRAFRYGGDEFAVLLPQTEITDAYRVAERIRNKISYGMDTGSVTISASIGVACWPDDGVSHTDILDAADTTLYKVKRSGRNRTGCTSPISGTGQTMEEVEESDAAEEKIKNLILVLAETVDAGNHFASGHSLRVAEYAVLIGRSLNLNREAVEKLETSAMLADIGKIGISDAILNKPGDLTDEEREIMKNHSRLGAVIAGNIPDIAHCKDAIMHHHERYDGAGYPDGLKGKDIPLEARILSIASAYAAMTSDRPYAPRLTYQQAFDELKENAGSQFDPELVDRFLDIQEATAAAAVKEARR